MSDHVGLPPDWQDMAVKAMAKMRADDPARDVFGLSFPKTWQGELMPYARSGELARLLGVRAITFNDGKTITRFDKPEEKKSA